MATGNKYRKIVCKVWTSSFDRQTDRQTYSHANHNTPRAK